MCVWIEDALNHILYIIYGAYFQTVNIRKIELFREKKRERNYVYLWKY